MTAPLLSVVVPAYNNGRTLRETIMSILAQEDIDLELVIADHSSTDDTRAVMDEFRDDARVRLLSTPAGGGAVRNWQHVSEMASGEFIKLVCGDDVLRAGVLARQVRLLSDPEVALTACRRDIVDSNGNVLMRGWGLRGITHRMPGTAAVRRCVRAGSNLFGEPASVMMRRSALSRSGGWFGEYPYLIDQATYSRVLLSGDFVPDVEVGATFRMSSAQWSVELSRDQAAQARGFHLWLRREYPQVVSDWDVRIGNARAGIMARLRRLSYWLLRRRMR